MRWKQLVKLTLLQQGPLLELKHFQGLPGGFHFSAEPVALKLIRCSQQAGHREYYRTNLLL